MFHTDPKSPATREALRCAYVAAVAHDVDVCTRGMVSLADIDDVNAHARQTGEHFCDALHDHIDPNQTMLNAFAYVFGRPMGLGSDPSADADCALSESIMREVCEHGYDDSATDLAGDASRDPEAARVLRDVSDAHGIASMQPDLDHALQRIASASAEDVRDFIGASDTDDTDDACRAEAARRLTLSWAAAEAAHDKASDDDDAQRNARFAEIRAAECKQLREDAARIAADVQHVQTCSVDRIVSFLTFRLGIAEATRLAALHTGRGALRAAATIIAARSDSRP